MDRVISIMPNQYRSSLREVRFQVTDALKKVRKELFALRGESTDYLNQLTKLAEPMYLEVIGDVQNLDSKRQRVINELVRNAVAHSKGRRILIEVTDKTIVVSDDGVGLAGVSQIVDELDGQMQIESNRMGTKIKIQIP